MHLHTIEVLQSLFSVCSYDVFLLIFHCFAIVKVSATDQGASMSGYLHRWHKKKWKKNWYLIKDKVLFTFKATQVKPSPY